LNVILQRNGIGLLSGIGFSDASIKTNYIDKLNHYEITSSYKLVRDSVPFKNRYITYIEEVDDTIGSTSEEISMAGQVPQNTLRWLQVPLKFSYQYPIWRMRFSARVGVDLLYLYKASGSIVNDKLDGLTTIGEGEHKLNRLNCNANAQIRAGYQLNTHFQVGGSLYYNQQLGSNFKNYNSRFQSRGIGWYVGYAF